MRPDGGAPEPSARASEKLRLFVAADVPGPITARVDGLLTPFRTRLPGFRWTSREGWHVTLKFLGWVAPERRAEVEDAVRFVASAVPSFDTAIARIGVFPTPGRARVLWAGLDDVDGAFPRMVKRLDDRLASLVRPEERAFSPHLTLARIQPPARMRHVAPDLLELDVASERFPVNGIVLYRSRLSRSGARYEPLVTAPLRAPLAGSAAEGR
jgi:2'-5' RNA ligase